jgi:hypothetical protein
MGGPSLFLVLGPALTIGGGTQAGGPSLFFSLHPDHQCRVPYPSRSLRRVGYHQSQPVAVLVAGWETTNVRVAQSRFCTLWPENHSGSQSSAKRRTGARDAPIRRSSRPVSLDTMSNAPAPTRTDSHFSASKSAGAYRSRLADLGQGAQMVMGFSAMAPRRPRGLIAAAHRQNLVYSSSWPPRSLHCRQLTPNPA